MSRIQRTAAGRPARRPAAVLALAAALGIPALTSAHGPAEKKLRTEPAPGTVFPTTPGIQASDLVAPWPRDTRVTGTAQPLRELAAEAIVIALADTARTEILDEGRLHVYRLHVARVLRGRLDEPEPAVVDARGDSRRPPLLADGERAVVLLRQSPPLSYLKEHLPAGTIPWVTIAGRAGVLPVGGAADAEAIEQALAEGARVAAGDEAARRRLAFAELGSPSSVVVADGVIELDRLPAFVPCTSEETATLGRVLASAGVDAHTRVQLLQYLGLRGDASVVPALRAARADTPEVVTALFGSRALLGAPPTRQELVQYLDGKDAGLRAAGVRALGTLPGVDVNEIGRYALADPNLNVRVAAVEALGATRRPEAVPILTTTFADPARELRQKSAQALIAIGGPTVDDALIEVALRGTTSETKQYAALVLLMTHGRDGAPVQRLKAAKPTSDVQHVLDHGLEFTHSHKHD